MQLRMNLSNRQQIKKAWAFAVDQSRAGLRRHNNSLGRDFQSVVITSASKEARIQGVQTGMNYQEAKSLIPDLKILVVN